MTRYLCKYKSDQCNHGWALCADKPKETAFVKYEKTIEVDDDTPFRVLIELHTMTELEGGINEI